jgi:hypothetical protein
VRDASGDWSNWIQVVTATIGWLLDKGHVPRDVFLVAKLWALAYSTWKNEVFPILREDDESELWAHVNYHKKARKSFAWLMERFKLSVPVEGIPYAPTEVLPSDGSEPEPEPKPQPRKRKRENEESAKPAKRAKRVRLPVKTGGGDVIDVHIRPTDSVARVKRACREALGIDATTFVHLVVDQVEQTNENATPFTDYSPETPPLVYAIAARRLKAN